MLPVKGKESATLRSRPHSRPTSGAAIVLSLLAVKIVGELHDYHGIVLKIVTFVAIIVFEMPRQRRGIHASDQAKGMGHVPQEMWRRNPSRSKTLPKVWYPNHP